MFLTQLRLDPRSAAARRDLANPYDMHRTLVRAFVQDEQQTPPRFLWRLEPGGAWERPTVLVQSVQPGQWQFLAEGPAYLHADEAVATKAWQPQALLTSGGRYRFRLLANPTVCRQGNRLGLVGEEAQLGWLQRQAQQHGFDLEGALVMGGTPLRGQKGAHRITLQQVHYEGVLVAKDVSALEAAVVQGIGPGKALGCGLLSLGLCR